MIQCTCFFGSSTDWVTVVLPELFVWRLCHAWRHCIVKWTLTPIFSLSLGTPCTPTSSVMETETGITHLCCSVGHGAARRASARFEFWLLCALLSCFPWKWILIYSSTRSLLEAAVAQAASMCPSCQHCAVRLAGDSRDAHRKQLSNETNFISAELPAQHCEAFPDSFVVGMTDLFSVF